MAYFWAELVFANMNYLANWAIRSWQAIWKIRSFCKILSRNTGIFSSLIFIFFYFLFFKSKLLSNSCNGKDMPNIVPYVWNRAVPKNKDTYYEVQVIYFALCACQSTVLLCSWLNFCDCHCITLCCNSRSIM